MFGYLPALYLYLTSDDPEEDVADLFSSSDWGTSAWAEDKDHAFGQAWEWMSTTATHRGWAGTDEHYSAQLLISDAYVDSDTTKGFWEAVTERYEAGPSTEYESLPMPEGWAKLTKAFAQAGNTTTTVEEARELGKPTVMLKAAAEKTIVEIQDKGGSTWETVRPWAIGGGIVLGLVSLAKVVK